MWVVVVDETREGAGAPAAHADLTVPPLAGPQVLAEGHETPVKEEALQSRAQPPPVPGPLRLLAGSKGSVINAHAPVQKCLRDPDTDDQLRTEPGVGPSWPREFRVQQTGWL